jgi:uncharacterized protein YjiK
MTWNEDSLSYYLVGDEGFLYEMDEDLILLNTVYLGDFDLEGITYNRDRKSLFCLDERTFTLIEVNPLSFSILKTYSPDLPRKKGKSYSQYESLIFIPQSEQGGGLFYIGCSVRTKKKKYGELYSFSLDKLELESVAHVPLWDISGMTYDEDYLYMISDEEDVIARYDRETEDYESEHIEGQHQEGLVFSRNHELIVVDESGAFYHLDNDIFE